MTHADLRLRRRPPTFGFTARQAQEEGEYEYAAYSHGGESGEEQTHLEEGLLYQPLGEASEPTTPTTLCASAAKGTPCARYADAWGFIESFGKEAENLYHKGKHFVHKLLHAIGFKPPNKGDYTCAAFGLGVSFLLTDSPFAEQVIYSTLSGLGCASLTK